MIEELEENLNKSLADNEIASLMKTLASKNYKENPSFPKKNVEPFKPTSFFEIAKKNISKDKNKFPKEKIDIDLKGDSTQQDNEIKEDNGKQFKEDTSNQKEQTNPAIENNNDIQQIDLGQTDANSEIPQEIDKQAKLNEDSGSLRKEPAVNVGVPIKENLYTKDLPDPEILIRTGNRNRLSNFLLWQLSYTEIFFVKKLWPDFTNKDFNKIILKFEKVKRNFGGIK